MLLRCTTNFKNLQKFKTYKEDTMEEKFFFNSSNVSVSNARFMVRGQTYAMNGVTSVKQTVAHPSRVGPIVLGLISLLVAFVGSLVFGILGLILAVVWWINQKSIWYVILSSSSGETRALSSSDRGHIDGVIEALNQSIIYRG
jgi:Family of unknown function (DUF6232)